VSYYSKPFSADVGSIQIYSEEENKIIQNIYRYIVKNIKKRRLLFFCIGREENIRPQVLRDKISPPFFQHYEKKNMISYP
jgi:hypothetical protein